MTDTAAQLIAGKEAAIAALADKNGRGGARKLAAALGISEPAISQWDAIPFERVSDVEAITGISRSILRPDHFGRRTAKRRAPRRKAA